MPTPWACAFLGGWTRFIQTDRNILLSQAGPFATRYGHFAWPRRGYRSHMHSADAFPPLA